MGSIIGTVILLAVLVVSAFLLILARQKKLISSARRKDNAIVSPRASVWAYRAKHIEKRRNSDNILRLLAPSVIGGLHLRRVSVRCKLGLVHRLYRGQHHNYTFRDLPDLGCKCHGQCFGNE